MYSVFQYDSVVASQIVCRIFWLRVWPEVMKPSFNQITVYNALSHLIHEQYYSKWDLVGDSGGSPGLENAVKRWGWLSWFLFLFTSMQACEKRMSKPVKNILASPLKTLVFNELTPYGVGRYYDMAVSPTRSHLLWTGGYYNTKIVHHIMV